MKNEIPNNIPEQRFIEILKIYEQTLESAAFETQIEDVIFELLANDVKIHEAKQLLKIKMDILLNTIEEKK